ncbi:zf-HC2 domain-containing protein [Variovorax ginsengisoli]|uniref:Zf-HC2 domain-containing protein n=1 Tax=Variovorax ginsengisoli TaxID=363844 RepID=A0ABT8SC59_9BURK|nr:zf-HC2 domain-containing protein [Variovorax ginsengisoli]MDN8617332.1 zf-HC2 domain-containing protein [Variovorax ginsengisoli]MDO1536502.1 zf-HC2 domain-containing protein [Variovorax ginsengisoli]
MSGQVVPLGSDVHLKVQSLLPWYVGATLEAQERAGVEAHLADCPRCRAELTLERALQAAYAATGSDDAPGDADQGFAALRGRLVGDAAPPVRRGLLAGLRDRWRESPPWTRWALAGQCVLVAALGGLLVLPMWPEPRYRALGEPAAVPAGVDGGQLIVRFRPDATEQEMRRVLRDSRARLVYGPTTTDAYLLAVPAGLETAAVQRLRQEKAVLLVESLDRRAAP